MTRVFSDFLCLLLMCSDCRPRFSNNNCRSFWWPIIIRSAGRWAALRPRGHRPTPAPAAGGGAALGVDVPPPSYVYRFAVFLVSRLARRSYDKRLHRKHDNNILSSCHRLNHDDDDVYNMDYIYNNRNMRICTNLGWRSGYPVSRTGGLMCRTRPVQGNVPTPHDSSVVMSERARVACALHTGKRSPLQGHCPTPSTPTYLPTVRCICAYARVYVVFFIPCVCVWRLEKLACSPFIFLHDDRARGIQQ